MEKEKTNKLVSFAMRQSMYDKLNKICEKDFKTMSDLLRELVVKRIREDE